jgi:hypothetical protein
LGMEVLAGERGSGREELAGWPVGRLTRGGWLYHRGIALAGGDAQAYGGVWMLGSKIVKRCSAACTEGSLIWMGCGIEVLDGRRAEMVASSFLRTRYCSFLAYRVCSCRLAGKCGCSSRSVYCTE